MMLFLWIKSSSSSSSSNSDISDFSHLNQPNKSISQLVSHSLSVICTTLNLFFYYLFLYLYLSVCVCLKKIYKHDYYPFLAVLLLDKAFLFSFFLNTHEKWWRHIISEIQRMPNIPFKTKNKKKTLIEIDHSQQDTRWRNLFPLFFYFPWNKIKLDTLFFRKKEASIIIIIIIIIILVDIHQVFRYFLFSLYRYSYTLITGERETERERERERWTSQLVFFLLICVSVYGLYTYVTPAIFFILNREKKWWWLWWWLWCRNSVGR